jgi:glycosyltransferase involved in cell wall biosynthesis
MDLVAEMLEAHLSSDYRASIQATLVRPSYIRIFGRVANQNVAALNADRLFNRFVRYPLWLRAHRDRFDLFHVADHSYSQLVHRLPADRTIVSCHDLDTFRSILEPPTEQRSRPFRAMARYILRGLQRAARVICATVETQQALIQNRLVPASRTCVIPYGVHPAFSAPIEPRASAKLDEMLGKHAAGALRAAGALDVLHVGSTIPRKRIDVLLRTFAGVAEEFPTARLVRVGSRFTPAQQQLARELGIDSRIVELPFLERDVLAAMYRRAAVVLLPSEAEGFGLPIIEAMAGGQTVVASDLAVLREVGGDAVAYCSVGDVPGWIDTVVRALRQKSINGQAVGERRDAALARAARFSWSEYAAKYVEVYRAISPSRPTSADVPMLCESDRRLGR